jgi:hypothetical protein
LILIDYGKEGKNDAINYIKYYKLPDNLMDLSYNKSLIEIDCKMEYFKKLWSTYYDSDGKVIYTFDKPGEYRYLIQDSAIDKLTTLVCEGRPSRTFP